jgi:hypothetical protein
MGTILRVVLTLVAFLFFLLFLLAMIVNLFNIERDNLTPEWIQASFGIYFVSYILIFGFKPPRKATMKDVTTKLKKMGSDVSINIKKMNGQKKESRNGLMGFKWLKKNKQEEGK